MTSVCTDSARPTHTATYVVRRLQRHNTFSDRCFATAGPRLWNSLPSKLRLCDSLGEFKRLLKTPSGRQHNQRSQLETEKETLSYLCTNCQPLEQSITEGRWCYDVEQFQKSAWEKKKSGDGLLRRLTVFQVLLAARPSTSTKIAYGSAAPGDHSALWHFVESVV